MDNLKYDSIYKFIVSLGIILIILPFVIAYYFFNSNDIVLINQEQIAKLTETSVQIIKFKQNFILSIINLKVYFIFAFIFVEILGFALVVIGLKLWNKNVQDIENKKLMLEYKISERNLTQLSVDEKKSKVKEEIIATNNKKHIKINEKEIKEYIKKEKEIVDIIQKIFYEYKLLSDVKVGKHSVDCLVPYSNPDNLLAKAFEIRYVKNSRITLNYINSAKVKMEEFASAYYCNFSQFCLVCTLFVVDNMDKKFLLENKNIIDEIELYNSKIHNSQICKIFIVDKNNVKEKIGQLKNNINLNCLTSF